MAGGGVAPIGAAGRASEYQGGITAAIMFVALIAASGGLLFGEALGLSGETVGGGTARKSSRLSHMARHWPT